MKVVKSIAANMVEEQSRPTKSNSNKLFVFRAESCARNAPALPRLRSIVPHLAFDFFAEN